MDNSEQAWSDYYDDFIRRKNEIITKLETIKHSSRSTTYRTWLEQAIEFIKEQKG